MTLGLDNTNVSYSVEQSLPQDSHMQKGTQRNVDDRVVVHNTAMLLYNEKRQKTRKV